MAWLFGSLKNKMAAIAVFLSHFAHWLSIAEYPHKSEATLLFSLLLQKWDQRNRSCTAEQLFNPFSLFTTKQKTDIEFYQFWRLSPFSRWLLWGDFLCCHCNTIVTCWTCLHQDCCCNMHSEQIFQRLHLTLSPSALVLLLTSCRGRIWSG